MLLRTTTLPGPKLRWIWISLMLLLSGCVELRELTYPPEFIYLDNRDVHPVMHALADSMYTIEDLLANQGAEDHPDEDALQKLVMHELSQLELLATSLQTQRAEGINEQALPSTNHLLIEQHLDQLLARVEQAKRQVAAERVNYFLVGQLTGGCSACHRRR